MPALHQQRHDGPATLAAQAAGVIATPQAEPDETPYYTSNSGQPFPDTAHALNVGGIPVASDTFLFEKQQHFNRGKVVERGVHPCGSGHFGYFEVTQPVEHLTSANFLSQVGKKTPLFLRFSTVTYGREYPDLCRNPRGFAVKFYTEEGNYDIVGLNWPIFFVRDPMLGPDAIRSQQRNTKNFLPDYTGQFDFCANVPEANHAGMMFFSDSGTPNGWNFHGYGCHTFAWVKDGQRHYIKYHFLKKTGQEFLSWDEAKRLSGQDPDYSKRDMTAKIEKGDLEQTTWIAHYQIMTPQQAENESEFDPFDVTKVWPKSKYPLHEFGKIVLNKNPDNYHRDVEQAAFSPGSLVPGIEPSPDELLQWRMFFYRDAQLYRIGANMHQIPVNCPFMSKSFAPLTMDGQMRVDANQTTRHQWQPNSFDRQKYCPEKDQMPVRVSDNMLSRQSHNKLEGSMADYAQATALYENVMDDKQRQDLHKNIAEGFSWNVPRITRLRYLAHQLNTSRNLAQGILDCMVQKDISMQDIEAIAKDAPMFGKSEKYCPKAPHHKLSMLEIEQQHNLTPPKGAHPG